MKQTEKDVIPELQLLSRYKETQDTEALGMLYNRYMELVFGLCMKYLKNTEDSQDAVMEVYELIANKLKTHDVDNFKSWLYVVAKNHCLEKLRKDKQVLTKEKELQHVQSVDYFHPDDVNEKESKYNQLEQCLSRLPKLQKKMIDLFYYQKKSYSEIVEKEQLSWNVVRSNIQNGRRNLKKCIEAHD